MNDAKLSAPTIELKQEKDLGIYSIESLSPAISFLASSNACGIAMLVNKLLDSRTSNAATKHLIRTLINRLPYNTIVITPSSEDQPESFISETIRAAFKFSNSHGNGSLDAAASLLTKAIKAFEMKSVGFSTLEHNWKEFIFHLFRVKLQHLDAA